MQTSSTCPAAQALWNLEAVRFIILLNYQSLAPLFEIGVLTTVKVLQIMPAHLPGAGHLVRQPLRDEWSD